MNIILQEDFPSLGYVGDKVNVKPGYARNFLFPKGIAIEASSSNAKLLAHKVLVINAKKTKKKSQADTLKFRMESLSLSFNLKAGNQGKSFGSVTIKDIQSALKTKGFDVDSSQIKLLEHMKTAGEFKVNVKLHSEVSALVPMVISLDKAQNINNPEAQDNKVSNNPEVNAESPKKKKDGKEAELLKDKSVN